jgi:hypothetical protein
LVQQSVELTQRKREEEDEVIRRLFTQREQQIIKRIVSHRSKYAIFGLDATFVFGVGSAAVLGALLGRFTTLKQVSI